ncbi:MAG: hypothetical protein JW966_16345, partial [Anaerolineae bacterium]|nr:hypothetical protein [Anaerolineae bacterium]
EKGSKEVRKGQIVRKVLFDTTITLFCGATTAVRTVYHLPVSLYPLRVFLFSAKRVTSPISSKQSMKGEVRRWRQ